MLTVEIRDFAKAQEGKAEVEIYCDSEGFAELLRQIRYLEHGESHVHLMTNSWAGNELTEKRSGRPANNTLVHSLKIVRVVE